MKTEKQLQERSGNRCELCNAKENLHIYNVPVPIAATHITDNTIYICNTCFSQIEKKQEPDSNHWSCLKTTMWSEIPAVQIVSWRILNRFRNETWAADHLEMMYLDDDMISWAKATGDHEGDANLSLHKDTNGNILITGDTVTLIKDLDVKGSTINAKIGTAIRNIHLVYDNTTQIEGKIEGQTIIILTKFVKKQF